MNVHAKFWWQFIFCGHYVNMNYHKIFEASSLKIQSVMLDFGLWRPFCFFCGHLFAAGGQDILPCKILGF